MQRRCGSVLMLNLLAFTAVAVRGDETSTGAYCPAYCSESNEYESGFDCSTASQPYCCGDVNTRYCCSNSSLDISDDYEDVCYTCYDSPCGAYDEWTMFLVAAGAAVTVVFIAICLCLCCASSTDFCWSMRCCCQKSTDTGSTSSEVDISSNSRVTPSSRHGFNQSGNNHGLPPPPDDFDPDHPFAFHPPHYDSLAGEPPKYDDIEMMETSAGRSADVTGLTSQGVDNAAFQLSESGLRENLSASCSDGVMTSVVVDVVGGGSDVVCVPPPSYEETIGRQEERHSRTDAAAAAAAAAAAGGVSITDISDGEGVVALPTSTACSADTVVVINEVELSVGVSRAQDAALPAVVAENVN